MSRLGGRAGQLGAFLRARREALPGVVRGRPRTPGLRRDDVAASCDISLDYYTRLEQGRAASLPSVAVTEALARAFELNPAEKAHLYRLTGRAAPEVTDAETAAPNLLFIMEKLGNTPAQVLSDLGIVLAQNEASAALFAWILGQGLHRANVYERWFCHADVRAAFPREHRRAYSEAQAGELRAAATRRALAGDDRGHDLVAELSERSAEFRRAWDAHHVHDGRDKRLWIPAAPGFSLQAHVTVDNHTNQRLIAFEKLAD